MAAVGTRGGGAWDDDVPPRPDEDNLSDDSDADDEWLDRGLATGWLFPPPRVITVQTEAPPPLASTPPPQPQEEAAKDWIEIELVDEAGNPVGGQRYHLELADGSTRDGSVDAAGRARVEGLEPGSAAISFPDLHAGDWDAA